MRISLASDLHLEMCPEFRLTNPGTDVLILSGDICVVNHFLRGSDSPYHLKAMEYFDFFKSCSQQWNKIFVVMGNHEYYHGYIDTYAAVYREQLKEFGNITLLNNNFEDYEGIRFIGGTLWTDMDNYSPITEMMIERYMNDFKIIQWKRNYSRFRATDAEYLFGETKHFFETNIDPDMKTVVIAHHAPSDLSIAPQYKGDAYNGGYRSQLDQWIRDRPNITLFTHGHVHNPVDVMIGNTRVAANPKGYPNEPGTDFDFERVYEV